MTRSKFEEKQQELRLDMNGKPIQISVDRDKMKQVIINLLSNATKYTPAGGKVTISANTTSDEVIICVSDNGRGIPPEYLPHLFEKFYRVPTTEHEAQGSGLGLFICKRIIDAHGGRMNVDSTYGLGTTVTVRLPFIA